MGKRIVLTEEEKNVIRNRYNLNEEVNLTITPNNEGGVNINDKFAYKLETDSWIPVGISIVKFDKETGDFKLNAPVVGEISGKMAPEKIQNLGLQMSQGKSPVKFEVEKDGETKELRFVKS